LAFEALLIIIPSSIAYASAKHKMKVKKITAKKTTKWIINEFLIDINAFEKTDFLP
jgi:hypothetical protein